MATYYIDGITGSDSTGAGTLISPWKTLFHAIPFTAAPDTISMTNLGGCGPVILAIDGSYASYGIIAANGTASTSPGIFDLNGNVSSYGILDGSGAINQQGILDNTQHFHSKGYVDASGNFTLNTVVAIGPWAVTSTHVGPWAIGPTSLGPYAVR